MIMESYEMVRWYHSELFLQFPWHPDRMFMICQNYTLRVIIFFQLVDKMIDVFMKSSSQYKDCYKN